MILCYENSKGQVIDLLKKPYRTVEADIYNTSWKEESSGYEKSIEIDVVDDPKKFADHMNTLYEIFAVDSENGVYGKLWCNGSYILCNLKEKETDQWKGNVYSYVTLTFYAPNLAWITEEQKSFVPVSGGISATDDAKNYPHDYPYNYATSVSGTQLWDIVNTTAMDFAMIVYGPCAQPAITISGHLYSVNTTLQDGEYMIVDSQTYTIYKHLTDGSNISLFNDRNTESSVFDKIPAGLNKIEWDGAYGFDIIVYKTRREPQWK